METTILTIDYSMSPLAMVMAGNYYDDVRHGSRLKLFAENKLWFPLSGIGKVYFEPKLFPFTPGCRLYAEVDRMKADGFAPADIEHLLAFGAASPDYQQMCGFPWPYEDQKDLKKEVRDIAAPGSVRPHSAYYSWVRLTSSGTSRLLETAAMGSVSNLLAVQPWTYLLGIREVKPKS